MSQLGSCNQLKGLWPELDYHFEQADLWYCPERFIYAPCGRQSGKTELAMRRLVAYLPVPPKGNWRDPRYFYGGPTYQQAKRVAWRKLLNLIPKHWVVDKSESETYIRTIFGSELYVAGLDRPQRIEGLTWDGGVIDENSDIKPEVIRSVLPMLGLRHGWLWRIGVPKRFGVGAAKYRRDYEKACRGELPDSTGFWWPSSIHMPEDELELARTTLDEYDYEEQYNASWLSAGGGVFHAFDRAYHVRPCDYHFDQPILVGSDFNVNPMCWVFCHLRGDILEVFDELFIRNTNTPAALQVLLSKYSGHKGGFQMYGDASSRGRHTSAYLTDYNHIASNLQLKAMGRTMHYLRGNPPMADRFAATNARICSGDGAMRVFIDDTRCPHLIGDLEIRTYKPNTREADDSDKDVGHPSDALGYLIYKKWPLHLRMSSSSTVVITEGNK